MTCWLEQDCILRGRSQHISAPASVLMRRIDDDWRVALVHAVPMPPEEYAHCASALGRRPCRWVTDQLVTFDQFSGERDAQRSLPWVRAGSRP